MSVTVTDTQIPSGDYALTADVPAAKYSEICTTLNCQPGEVAQTLLLRVSEETDARLLSSIMLKLRQVKAVGKLGLLDQRLSEGGDLASLLIE